MAAPTFSDAVFGPLYITVGSSFSRQLAAASGGDGAVTYTAPLLPPPGMAFNALSRTLSGRPTQTGRYEFAYDAVDANGQFATAIGYLYVRAAARTNPTISGGTGTRIDPYIITNPDSIRDATPRSFNLSDSNLAAYFRVAASVTGDDADWVIHDDNCSSNEGSSFCEWDLTNTGGGRYAYGSRVGNANRRDITVYRIRPRQLCGSSRSFHLKRCRDPDGPAHH